MLAHNDITPTVFKNGEIKPVPPTTTTVILQNYYYDDFLQFMWRSVADITDLTHSKKHYTQSKLLHALNSGHFIVGPFWHNQILLNISITIDRKNDALAALVGISFSTAIHWDGSVTDLPTGWQGSINRSYHDKNQNRPANTLIALGITIEDAYKNLGWSEQLILGLKNTAKRLALQNLIIPLMPPQRYQLEYAAMPFTAFAELKRDDGQHQDHWVRKHTKMGATILCCTNNSHRWLFSVQEFMQWLQPSAIKIHNTSESPIINQFTVTGEYFVEVMDRWYKIFVVLENDIIIIDQGGVWVKHSL